ncbi:ATP synthase F0 subunit 6 (mitochondrion) [Eublepharis macularius]|uniref:ATP synthase subunit a n=1 Tax=Eublepharis macularius TaxID=481883 RepID=A0A1L7NTY7_EUBMA|nr:ATP synthase F0 subunit 6 [Eublepharis macularius]WEF49955.1 ATP synthase F0 subunit 6 [Eublepharis macularius]BAW33378.1 ATP synthase F0 subunit 6 [Eublepharis macularius]
MMLNFFNQFSSPLILGIPLLPLAMLAPTFIMIPRTTLTTNRLIIIQQWIMKQITKQLMLPIKTKGHKWALTLTTLMASILMMNLLGLLPYTFTPTTQLSMNLGIAMPLWMMTIITGLRNQPTNSLGHLLPMGTPNMLIIPLILIETVSLFIRPIALGVRLTANLTAGHLLMQLISIATLTLMSTMPTIAVLSFSVLLLLTLLEMAVAMIQAYVFVLLVTLYLQENM